MSEQERKSEQRLQQAANLGACLLAGLAALEDTLRRLHPPRLGELAENLRGPAQQLEEALAAFESDPGDAPEEHLRGFEARLQEGAQAALQALGLLGDAAVGAGEGIASVLEAMQQHCVAQEAAFSLRRVIAPLNRYFLEPFARDQLNELDPQVPHESVPVGIHQASNQRDLRGGFTLYVPESYAGSAWPLVVALHGGGGHGADFLWTWLREARSRQFLLLAPTSRGPTWSMNGPDVDAQALRSMLAFVGERWEIAWDSVLLTGLSDGGTYSLLCGLQEESLFTALAPIAGVLHPANFANGNLDRVSGRRIYWAHGALDWMFPIELARKAAQELRARGAALEFREIEDLSHTYPREQNAEILDWFLAGTR